jgi:hypothetical protein
MSSTLENINNNINLRIESVSSILNIYNGYKIDEADELLMNICSQNLNEIKENYVTVTISTIKDFYTATDEPTKRDAHNRFIKAFHAVDTIGKLKKIYNFCVRMRKIYEFSDECLPELFRSYEYAVIDESFEDNGSEICPICKITYEIEEKTSEFTCKNCGHIEKMYGVVFEDEQFFYQEGQRTKHGKYDPIKHAKFWTDRIQAKESTDIPETVINSIKRCIRRDRLWIDRISCEVIRGYLKQLKITHYNNHIPLIRKIITGREPPQFTDHELRLLYMYFSKVIQIFNQKKGTDKSNCPYHPYFIYKIVEQLLKSRSNFNRKTEILSCIHLQSRETLIENDKMWFLICDHIPEFTKLATDSNH